MHPGTNSKLVWDKLRKLKNPSAQVSRIEVDVEFLKNFSDKLCPAVNQEIQKKNNTIKNDLLDREISFEEFELAISHNKNTSVGFDEINYEMVRKLPINAKKLTVQIFNIIYEKSIAPEQWRTHLVVPILKPGKNEKEASSYRPISLFSYLGKTFENILKARLEWFLENKRQLGKNQYGARKTRSVQDCLNCLNLKIQETYSKNHYFVVAFLDIKGAYDNVNLEVLYNELTRYKVSQKMCEWIYSYYKNKKFYVKLDNFINKSNENRSMSNLFGPRHSKRIMSRINNGGIIIYNVY